MVVHVPFVQPLGGYLAQEEKKNPQFYHRFTASRHTKPSCQLESSNKRWWESLGKKSKKERKRVCGESGEGLINEEKCIVPVSWADEKRQDEVQGRLLGILLQSNYREQSCIKCIHLVREIVKNKLELQISISWIICSIQCLSEGLLVSSHSSISRATEYLKRILVLFYLKRKKMV